MRISIWTCKSCGRPVSSELQKCWSCGTSKDETPPHEPSVASSVNGISATEKVAPLSFQATSALSAVGIAIALIGIIGGIVVLVNSPEAPRSYATDALTEIQQANRMIYLVVGWSQIVGGLVSGLLLYVVGGIGQAVLDMWKAQQTTNDITS